MRAASAPRAAAAAELPQRCTALSSLVCWQLASAAGQADCGAASAMLDAAAERLQPQGAPAVVLAMGRLLLQANHCLQRTRVMAAC